MTALLRVVLAGTTMSALLGLLALCGGGGTESDPAEPPPLDPNREITQQALGVSACTGASIDPPAAELDGAAALLQRNDYPGGLARLSALASQYPDSATVRVRAAGAALHSTPHQTDLARRWYAEAKALHDRGCTLAPREEWSLLLGQGLSHMFDSRHADSLAPLSEAARRWPDSATTRYNLACSYCLTGDLGGCQRELAATLSVSSAGRHTPWEPAAPQTVAHYVALSARDSDLAALRATPAYEATVAPYR